MLRADPQTIVSRPTILSVREEVILYLHLVTSHIIDKAYYDIWARFVVLSALVGSRSGPPRILFHPCLKLNSMQGVVINRAGLQVCLATLHAYA
jgi:hypothetical protein